MVFAMLANTILLTDFGLMVLIWMVQLIAYPVFYYVERDLFIVWHSKYVQLISFFVVPLMILQFATHCMVWLQERTVYQGIGITLIGLIWTVTFTFSVPCHKALAKEGKNMEQITRLIRTNWFRTVGWSAVFMLTLWRY